MEEYKSPANSDRLFYSVWDGTSWSTAAQIEDSLPTVLNSSLTMHGEEGLLLYNLDMDNDMSTNEDREIFARVFDGASWGNSIRITDNQSNDILPKAIYANGKWFITWIRDEKIMYQQELGGETETAALLQNVQGDYKLTVTQGENPQVALVYKKLGENKAQTLSACFYDVGSDVWGGETTLTQDVGLTRSFSPVFTNDEKLNVAYTDAHIVTEVVNDVEQKNITDKVDLRTVTYSPMRDLALDKESGLHLSYEIPLPGTLNTVLATVKNEGDFPENAIVTLYDGNPSEGGVEIARAVLDMPVPARSSAEVAIEWLVGAQESDEYELYAVVRGEDGAQDENPDNNIISRKIFTSDIAITDLVCENVSGNDYLATATVANFGSKAATGTRVRLEESQGAEALMATEIERLEPGQKVSIDFLFSSEGLTADENGNINMALRALTPDGAPEYSAENNLYEFALEQASISVKTSNPGQSESLVGVETPLTLGFNMAVEEGEDFDGIVLADNELNEIYISKVLDGDTLTITPQSELQHDTRYELTVPAHAFGDAFGHSMSAPYVLSFATMSSSPQVIFSNPGSGMEDADTNSDIRLRFNQSVSAGSAFDGIALYRADSKEIAATAYLDGEWLTVATEAPLRANTSYSLVIPKGAVLGSDKEAQQQEFTLKFTTGATADNGGVTYYSGSTSSRSYNHKITRSTLEDGSSKAVVEIDKQSIGADATIALTDELKNDDAVLINIGADVLSTLSGFMKGLNVATGKGDIRFPADLITALAKERSPSLTIELTTAGAPTVKVTPMADGKQITWDNPDIPYAISIPYKPNKDEASNPESIVVRYTDSDGNVISIPEGFYNPATGTVSFSSSVFGSYAVGFNKVSFNDVPADAWYSKAVSFIAARGITLGTGAGKYSPGAGLTRGQLIVMLMRAYNILPDENSEDNFSDCGSTYYTGYLAAAKRLGLSVGVGNNMFAPEREISRQEMFTLLYNVLQHIDKLPQGDSVESITDFNDAEQIESWAKAPMSMLVEAGVIQGDRGKLLPADKMTRAELAQVLYNLFSKDAK